MKIWNCMKKYLSGLSILIGIFLTIISFFNIKQSGSSFGRDFKYHYYTYNHTGWVFFTAIGAVILAFGILKKISELKK